MNDERRSPRKNFLQLMLKLRRIGGLFLLFMVLVHASIHWVSQDVIASIGKGLPDEVVGGLISDAITRLNVVLAVSAMALVPIFVLVAVFVVRFVWVHFEELERMNHNKSQFVSMVSHELKTPLNTIKGYSDLLARGSDGVLNDGQAEYVEGIRKGAMHLKAIVSDLLDLSKIEAGKIELQISEFAIQDVLREALKGVAPLAKRRRLTFAESGDPKIQIRGDRTRIRQVLLNLLSNAVRFSPKGSTVGVSWAVQSERVYMTVADSGCGMDEKEQARIFQEFSQGKQAQHAEADVDEGTGLGLAISKKLVALQGGSIWVESSAGAGARFHFTLPSAKQESFGLVDNGSTATADVLAAR